MLCCGECFAFIQGLLFFWCLLSQEEKKPEEDSVNKRRRKGNHYLSEVGRDLERKPFQISLPSTAQSFHLFSRPRRPVVLSQRTPCWRGRGAAGEQGPLHGDAAAGQVRGKLFRTADQGQGETRPRLAGRGRSSIGRDTSESTLRIDLKKKCPFKLDAFVAN